MASLGGSEVHRNDVPTGGPEVMFTGGVHGAAHDVASPRCYDNNKHRSNATFFNSVFQCVFAVSAAENIPAMA